MLLRKDCNFKDALIATLNIQLNKLDTVAHKLANSIDSACEHLAMSNESRTARLELLNEYRDLGRN